MLLNVTDWPPTSMTNIFFFFFYCVVCIEQLSFISKVFFSVFFSFFSIFLKVNPMALKTVRFSSWIAMLISDG